MRWSCFVRLHHTHVASVTCACEVGLPPGRLATRAAGVAVATTAVAAAASHLAEVAVLGTTTATATRAAATATTAKGRLAGNGLEKGRNLLVGLLEKIHELPNDTAVATVEESGRNTSVSGTTGTTNTVNVVVDIRGKIVVDDVGDVGNIKTTSSNGSSNQDGAAAVAEVLEGALTLTLGAVTVNRGGGEVLVDEEVGQSVGHALRLDEDEGQSSGVAVQDVEQDRALVNVLDVFDLLGNVLRGGTNATDGQEDVVLQEITGKHLDVAGEGGRKHESLTVGNGRHVLTLDDTADLGLETHVQHSVGLVEHKVLNVAQGNATSLYEIDQSSRSGNQKIAATLNLAELGANIGTTVDDARANPRTVGKLARLLVDLGDQLTGGSQNQGGGVGLALTTKLTSSTSGDRRRTVEEGLRQDGEEETTSLSGTGLGTGHQIAATHDDGNGVLLDGGGNPVAGHLDVAAQVLIQRRGGELVNRLRDVLAGSLDGNVVVLLEVDTGVLLGRVVGSTEELTLDAGVGGSSIAVSLVCNPTANIALTL
jgi:hypothetical protein